MAKATRRYSAKLKFQMVLEALRGDKSPAEIAKACRMHPNSVGIWKRWFLERGPGVFAQGEFQGAAGRRVAELEQLLGKKEVEIALLKNFLGRTD
ncbi:MAG: helix-turn-helix domain-containing protein [Gemmatimonadota bacterium]|nr:helix-turn-helix domain-containing protein [Gemmatimonadota bacterium]MDH5197745.1 helix-turn-helix domain-containing protein [Gemmatimonadota bacterium]